MRWKCTGCNPSCVLESRISADIEQPKDCPFDVPGCRWEVHTRRLPSKKVRKEKTTRQPPENSLGRLLF